MPPSGADLVRAKITRLLNSSHEPRRIPYSDKAPRAEFPAMDHGSHIVYEFQGQQYRILVQHRSSDD